MKHVEELIQLYLAGELDTDRIAAVERHLEGCSRCRDEVQQARALWKMLGSAQEEPAQGPSIWPAVRARTLDKGNDSRDWFFGTRPWIRTGLATGALAAGLVAGVLLPGGSGEVNVADSLTSESSWLGDASWLSDSSWRSTGEAVGLDDILLGADLANEGNGS
jgi:anti-sigma factor RsiW